jgi:hypothetical protein
VEDERVSEILSTETPPRFDEWIVTPVPRPDGGVTWKTERAGSRTPETPKSAGQPEG